MMQFDEHYSYRHWQKQQLRREALSRFFTCLGATILGVIILFPWGS